MCPPRNTTIAPAYKRRTASVGFAQKRKREQRGGESQRYRAGFVDYSIRVALCRVHQLHQPPHGLLQLAVLTGTAGKIAMVCVSPKPSVPKGGLDRINYAFYDHLDYLLS